jgi:hypothetical protein
MSSADNTPYRAKPELWAAAKTFGRNTMDMVNCLLELRARVEALEAPLVERSPECVAQWPDCYEGGYDPRCCRFPKSCSCEVRQASAAANHLAKPDSSPAPAGSLVERVALTIAPQGCFAPDESYGEEARAAIREVAAWLRVGRMLHAAELLEGEVKRG